MHYYKVNKDTFCGQDYHEKTKHSEISVMTSGHYLDWDNRPSPFKIYTELPTIPLPLDFPIPPMNSILAISRLYPQHKQFEGNGYNVNNNGQISQDIDHINTNTPSLHDLSTILFFSGGITREIKHNSGTFYMRAASATGALYPIEMYIVCKDISTDLKAGIYHFNPAEFSLTNIRKGDHRPLLASIADNNQHIAKSPITIIFTSYAWRNAWKYQERSFRHWFWDSGVIAANLLATTASMNIHTNLIMGFIDDKVNNLLALEKEKEASIAMAALGIESSQSFAPHETDNAKKESPPLYLKIEPLSKTEIQYPEIWKTYNCSKLDSGNEVKEWIKSGMSQNSGFISLKEDLTPSKERILRRRGLSNHYRLYDVSSIGETILRRGSTRRFSKSSISFSTLSDILYSSTRGIPADFKRDTETLIDIYLIANDVEGLEKGGYFYNPGHNSLDHIKDKVSRDLSGYLCLNQSLFSDASAVLFLMSGLNKIFKTLGNRGYRASQFEAGIIAGKIYLSAYAHEIGASGSTFYDDAVTEFFLPHSKDKDTMIAIGIGNPSYKAHPGKIPSRRITREQLMRDK
jgi:SagB-type dehydrogenase family enzyme